MPLGFFWSCFSFRHIANVDESLHYLATYCKTGAVGAKILALLWYSEPQVTLINLEIVKHQYQHVREANNKGSVTRKIWKY